MACSCSYCALFCSCIKNIASHPCTSCRSIPIRSFGLNITASVPDNVRTGDTVSVSLAYSDGDPNNFYLSMYCTNNGKTDVSVSDVADFTSDTTEDISVVSFGWVP